MLKTKKWLLPLLGIAFAGSALAQADLVKFYKLDFVVKEVEGGKAVNSRSFATMLAVQAPGRDQAAAATIRAGGRVPVTTGNNTTSNTTYFDLGVNIDSRELREVQGDVSIFITADVSTIAQESPGAVPITRQNKWAGTVLLPAKKATVVFASDDMSSKRQLQLELTATPAR
jgi:hypothetical protein